METLRCTSKVAKRCKLMRAHNEEGEMANLPMNIQKANVMPLFAITRAQWREESIASVERGRDKMKVA